MSRDVYGRVSALLDGPKKGKSEFFKAYKSYCDLYDDFDALVTAFPPPLIPQTRLVKNPAGFIEQQYHIPYYCFHGHPTLEGMDDNQTEKYIKRRQREILDKWRVFMQVVEDLADNEYVHLVSPYTRVVQSYVYGGLLYEDVDVTETPYIVPKKDIRDQRIVRDPRTNEEYRRALMSVLYQNKYV